ncbi:MAG: hypothetical protein AB8B84_15695 [Granulosicoccus sp.]
MRNVSSIAFVVLVLSMFSVKSSFATGSLVQLLRDIPLPHGASIEWVSNDVSHNGTGLVIARYDSPLSHQETVEFYRHIWPGDSDSSMPGFIETEIANWLLISRLSKGINTVIQLDSSNSGQSTGFISSVDINRPVTATTTTNTLSGLELLSHTSSNDNKSKSSLSVYKSGRSLETLTELMMGKFQSEGWQLVDLRPISESKIVSYRRGDWGKLMRLDMVVSMSASGGSFAVVNEVNYEG